MGSAPDAGADDIDAAVQAARAAFRESGWPQLAPKERARYLRALADEFEKHNDELGALVTMENGMALSVCGAFNGIGSATRYRYFAGLAESWDPEEVRGYQALLRNPTDSYFLAQAVTDAGIPPGVVNIVTGGDATGAALVAHPVIDMAAFTGSSAVGRKIAAACGASLKRVTLELGGKSAASAAKAARRASRST